ncbi:NADP-dependent oxidoreductase domain-containing protein 1 isoform X3 [Homo sapiens]|uniref:NADP-dependent oxidoreductase domain-containing protein 1 isoform X3 n=1 Tax=Homo sapiens TaxID=9606 RepID=UPI000387B677|nr:NADP-dependent oxidoreductase domain-containing protein 1 isoform X3 [Homo sapiens]XP_054231372.1 NADP-dependent oxidoreductase domain-containing protein 1 isoform X3 [Homo sapiens]|eukprot:XP_016876458.1 NADP-dependent oxidoreductase domain-containing protein 1 isoform X3 [Homo sapiens]
MDMLQDLESLQFEYGVPEEDRIWLYLQGRSRGLMIEACAHATFFCKLLYNLRASLNKNQSSRHLSIGSLNSATPEEFKVGIIGGGHLGKQLAGTLLQLGPIPAESLRISTRRPETLGELQKLGIKCFYHNADLVSWADVIFLCCLPSQLPNICVEIYTSLEKASIVYSFVAAIPLPRPFPWFDLTAVQLKETPFSQHLSSSPVLQDHLTHLYCASFGISLTKEQPVISTGFPSQ